MVSSPFSIRLDGEVVGEPEIVIGIAVVEIVERRYPVQPSRPVALNVVFEGYVCSVSHCRILRCGEYVRIPHNSTRVLSSRLNFTYRLSNCLGDRSPHRERDTVANNSIFAFLGERGIAEKVRW